MVWLGSWAPWPERMYFPSVILSLFHGPSWSFCLSGTSRIRFWMSLASSPVLYIQLPCLQPLPGARETRQTFSALMECMPDCQISMLYFPLGSIIVPWTCGREGGSRKIWQVEELPSQSTSASHYCLWLWCYVLLVSFFTWLWWGPCFLPRRSPTDLDDKCIEASNWLTRGKEGPCARKVVPIMNSCRLSFFFSLFAQLS